MLEDAVAIVLRVDVVKNVLLEVLVVAVVLERELEGAQVLRGDRQQEALHPKLLPVVGPRAEAAVFGARREPLDNGDLVREAQLSLPEPSVERLRARRV